METMTAPTTEKRLEDLAKSTDHSFDQVDRRFDQVDRRFEQVDQRFEQVDQRFDQVDQRFEQVDRRIDDLARATSHRFDRVEDDLRELRVDVKSGFEAIDAKFDAKLDSLNRTIIYLLGGTLSVSVGGLIAAIFHAFS